MKKILLLIILLSAKFSYSIEFEFEKINEFAFTHSYGANNSIIIDDDFCYTLSAYGLEIYQLNDDQGLEFITRLNIINATSMQKYENYIFIKTSRPRQHDPRASLFKIDISDCNTPFIVDQLAFDYPGDLDIIHNYVHISYLVNSVKHNIFYNVETLEIEAEITEDIGLLFLIDDDRAISPAGYNQYRIYDLSDIHNIELTGSSNIGNEQENCFNFEKINEDLIVAIGDTKLSFWDISNPFDWQFVSSFELSEDNNILNNGKIQFHNNRLILPTVNGISILSIDDISNPEELFFFDDSNLVENARISSAMYGNDMFLSTLSNGLKQYRILENSCIFIRQYADFFSINHAMNIGNNLIISCINKPLKYFDITDPNNPVYGGNLTENDHYSFFEINDNILAAHDIFGFNPNLDIYDISDIENPVLLNTIQLGYQSCIQFDSAYSDYIYIQNSVDSFQQFDISEQNNAVLNYQINTDFDINSFRIIDGYGYFLDRNYNNQSLYIYKELASSNPVLCNIIHNISNNSLEWLLSTNNMLYLSTISSFPGETPRMKFLSLEDPENPVILFETDVVGRAFQDENVLFVKDYNHVFLFNIPSGDSAVISPIGQFYDNSFGLSILPYQIENQKYFFYVQSSNISNYQYEIVTGNNNFEISDLPTTLSNYPNPFRPAAGGARSASTTINYALPQAGAAEIIIYNLKGQKIKTLFSEQQLAGEHSVTWDGRNESGKAVASGVYLYQLQLDGQSVARQKMMLVK